jgi:hypothetical protein
MDQILELRFCNYVFKYDGIELCVSNYVTICVLQLVARFTVDES